MVAESEDVNDIRTEQDLGKIFGPIGFVLGVARGDVPATFGATILTNDLIWWFPFASILIAARRAARREER